METILQSLTLELNDWHMFEVAKAIMKGPVQEKEQKSEKTEMQTPCSKGPPGIHSSMYTWWFVSEDW